MDKIRERLKNQGVNFTRWVAEEQLKRIGLTLSAEWSRQLFKPRIYFKNNQWRYEGYNRVGFGATPFSAYMDYMKT